MASIATKELASRENDKFRDSSTGGTVVAVANEDGTPIAAITGYATEATLATRLSESDFDTKTGSLTETAPATDTASSGLNGRLQRIAQRLTSLITAIGSPFQAGGSIGNTTFASTQSGTWNITNVSGTVSLPTGASTEATLATRLSESDFDTKTGSLTETAPSTDTASSGLNGRLQRIAQRLTSLIALIPAALTGSGNFKVSLQESNATQTVSGTVAATQSGTWSITNVSGTVSLPTGASTSALQTTGNTSLSSIDTKTYATPTTVFAGQKTVAVTNTAVAIASSQAVLGVIVQALSANVNSIYVGPSTVTTANGFELQPGQATSVAITNLSTVFINGTSGDGICYIGS